MSNLSDLIDRLKLATQARGSINRGELQDLASEYTDACRRLNQRLARCDEFLREGLISEAVHHAEVSPRVLDQLTLLDFPGRALWISIADENELESPPPIAYESAKSVNRAYADEKTIEKHLKTHRRLALARAPVKDRLKVMKTINSISAHPFWEEDIEEYERFRIQEITKDLNEAYRLDDVTKIDELWNEIQETTWRSEIPGSLRKAVKDSRVKLRSKACQQELEQLVVPLNNALAAFDADDARQLKAQWDRIVMDSPEQLDDSINQEVSEVFDWLRNLDAKDEKIKAGEEVLSRLEHTLTANSDVNRFELQSLYDQVISSGMDVPSHIPGRVQTEMRRFAARETFKRRLIFGSLGSVCIIFLIIAYPVYLYQKQFRTLSEIEIQANGFFKLNDLAGAQEYLRAEAKTYDWLQDEPRFHGLENQVARLVALRENRRRQFEQRIDEMESLDPTGVHDSDLKSLETLASTDSELLIRVQQLRKARDSALEIIYDKTTKEIGESLASLSTELVENSERVNRGEMSSAIETALDELRIALIAVDSRVQLDARLKRAHGSSLIALRSKLDIVEGVLRTRIAEKRFISELTRSTGDIATYKSKLVEHIGMIPDSPRTAHFNLLGERYESWNATLEWNRTVSRWRKQVFPKDLVTATKRLEECKAFISRYQTCPDYDSIKAYLDYTAKAVARYDTDGAVSNLMGILQDPLIAKVWAIEHKAGTYYVSKDPARFDGTDPFTAAYIIDYQLTEKRKLFNRKDIKQIGLSTQSKMARTIIAQIQNHDFAVWDKTLLDVAETIRTNNEIDDLLKHVLLVKVIGYARESSVALDEVLAREALKIDMPSFDDMALWMDPGRDVDIDRIAADNIAGQLNFDLLDDVVISTQRAGKALDTNRRWIGWIRKNDQQWITETKQPLVEKTLAWVISKASDGTWGWSRFGSLNAEGTFVLDGSLDYGKLLEGQLLFASEMTIESE